MSVALVGELSRVDRLDVEAHVARCRRCADVRADLRATAVALQRAYAPLRQASVALSPARARLAARTPVAVPASARFARLTTRIGEVALAAAVTAFAFVGAGSVAPEPSVIGDDQVAETQLTHVSARLDDATFVRWLRLDRYVPPDDLIDPTASIPPATPAADGSEGSGRLR